MVFDGIDAEASVYLNGALVLDANNMFRIWRVAAKSNLRADSNELRVGFPSPIAAAAKVASGDPFRLQSKTADKTYIRKAAYEYGWNWGPRFVASGIWKPARLEAWNKARIADFATRQRDISNEVVHLTADIDIVSSADGDAKLKIEYDDNGTPMVRNTIVQLHTGDTAVELPIEIQHPLRWYPNGYGEQ